MSKFIYKCPNRKNVEMCDACDSKGNLWANRESNDLDIQCLQNKEVKCLSENYVPQIFGQKMSKESIKIDRQKRSSKHFRESVYDAGKLSESEKKHFDNKNKQ